MERENRQNIRSASNKFNAHDLRGHYLFGVWAFGDASLSICNRPRSCLNLALMKQLLNEQKMKHIILSFLFACMALNSYAQTTYSPQVRGRNNNCVIESVSLTKDETIVRIKVPRVQQWGGWVKFSSATVLVPSDAWNINEARKSNLDYPDVAPLAGYERLYADAIKRIKEGRQVMSDAGFLIRSLGKEQLDTKYKANEKGRDFYYFELHFDRLPVGCEDVYIRELSDGGWEWTGIKINNPFPIVPNLGLSEASIKQQIDKDNDGIVGIYEGFSENKYKLGCIKDGTSYKLVYLGSNEVLKQWRIGDIKAILRPSATPGFFKADWYMANKTINSDVYIVFEGGSMKTVTDNGEDGYLKMYPTSLNSKPSVSESQEWSGTGFALNNGYIATNYHVIENANSIYIQGVKGDFSMKYEATIIASDKNNDLALLKISDNRFKGFGQIPYKVKTITSDVGEDIFVLGYPLTTTMGDEIKLTTGVISSKTGFQGDVALYQISAPVQPGNSGGPLFDGQGNLIGVVNAKHKGAENVSYAIKTSYLKNLVESVVTTPVFPNTNHVSNLALTGKVKSLKNFVYMINCSNQRSVSNNVNSKTINSSNSDIDITNPQIAIIPDNKGLKVTRVLITLAQTIVELEYDNTINQSGWISIDKDTYIVSYDTGEKYKMVKSEGIPIDPQKYHFSSAREKVNFRLIFPALPKNTTKFNLIENDNSTWNFFGIKLK